MQPRASTGLYPRTSSRRGFSEARSEVAQVFRSLPKLVVERMVDNLDLSSMSLLEDAILNIGGAPSQPHGHPKAGCLVPTPLLFLTSAGIGGVVVGLPPQRTRCFLCSRSVLPVLEATASIEAPSPDKMIDGTWRSISESFKEDFKCRYGRPQTDYERKLPGTSLSVTLNKSNSVPMAGGGVPYSPAELAAMMEDQAGKGLLFASDLDCPRFDSKDEGAEQRPHTVGVVFSPDMANAQIALQDAAEQFSGASTFKEAINLENKEHRGRVLKAAAGVAMAVLQCHSKLVAWALDNDSTRAVFKDKGADVFGCCARGSLPLIFVVQKGVMAHTIKEFADVSTVNTVLTKLGLAIWSTDGPRWTSSSSRHTGRKGPGEHVSQSSPQL